MQTPRKDNGEGDFIELDASPISFTSDPKVLVKATFFLLCVRQINECASGRFPVARRQQTHRAAAHIACPNQVVTADVLITFHVAPGNAKRGDDRTLILLVFMRQQETTTRVVK